LLSKQCIVNNITYKNCSTWRTILGKLLVFLYLKNFKNLETQIIVVMPRKSPLILETEINAVAMIHAKPLLAVVIAYWAILN
jgi:hypothetical protein